ncbi:MAG: iron chelate uptake ABC transporter family permease subunit, partial [Anaerolineales bacterium]|nr:iron chelate uptake ABC transporter family permease subunit [Anaerolineales bacterium]
MKLRIICTLIFLGILLVAASMIRIYLNRGIGGNVYLAFPEDRYLVYHLVPLVSALIVGAGLGVSGMGLQVLLRNPLASPWILGLSSGAGLGVMGSM